MPAKVTLELLWTWIKLKFPELQSKFFLKHLSLKRGSQSQMLIWQHLVNAQCFPRLLCLCSFAKVWLAGHVSNVSNTEHTNWLVTRGHPQAWWV